MDNSQQSVTDAPQDAPSAEGSPLLLTNKHFALLTQLKQQLRRILGAIKNRCSRSLNWLTEKFRDLSFSQWCYFIAAVMLLNFLGEPQKTEDYQIVVGVIAGAGLLRELWQTFMKIWEHTFGKGVLFVLYASTANIALAVSALKINSISGIEPQTFVFTMGFTTMLMLPFWILLASVFFLGSAIVLLSLWSFLSFVLRLFRIKLKYHWEDKSFALLTMWMRIIFIPFLMVVLFTFIEPYIEQLDMFDDVESTLFKSESFAEMSEEEVLGLARGLRDPDNSPLTEEQKNSLKELDLSTIELGMLRNMSDEDLISLVESVKSGKLDAIKALTKEENEPDIKLPNLSLTITGPIPKDTTNSSEEEDATEKAPEAEKERSRTLDMLIATFIYQFEAYRYSACRKEDNQRVLTIDENTIFVVEKDKTQELGYKFSVAACVPQWSEE